VVQLYVQDVVASVTRPLKELKGFRKVTLKPGEVQNVRFVLKPDALKFYGMDNRWVVEPGLFRVFVGGSSVDVLQGEFVLTE
jgi:beta-glucosidase